jgi:hypothetical protein
VTSSGRLFDPDANTSNRKDAVAICRQAVIFFVQIIGAMPPSLSLALLTDPNVQLVKYRPAIGTSGADWWCMQELGLHLRDNQMLKFDL